MNMPRRPMLPRCTGSLNEFGMQLFSLCYTQHLESVREGKSMRGSSATPHRFCYSVSIIIFPDILHLLMSCPETQRNLPLLQSFSNSLLDRQSLLRNNAETLTFTGLPDIRHMRVGSEKTLVSPSTSISGRFGSPPFRLISAVSQA